MKPVSKYILIAVFALAGSTAMYLYYFFVGCKSGTCLITSSPTISSGYGLLLGGLLGSSVTDWLNKRKKKRDTQ
ncbi:MAG: hypothetical protein KDC79_03960 [Cyclobacteriaceae bacterium]|nr:hypothetical protein [Cyclobacteriaceae bacterium]